MLNTLLIFIGAGLGGVLRFWITSLTYSYLGRQFPYGTLLVNVSGCFLMGFLFVLLFSRFTEVAPSLRSLLLIGLLGGYTTFSSFSIETIVLLESGAYFGAALNVLLSVTLSLFATGLGLIWARHAIQ